MSLGLSSGGVSCDVALRFAREGGRLAPLPSGYSPQTYSSASCSRASSAGNGTIRGIAVDEHSGVRVVSDHERERARRPSPEDVSSLGREHLQSAGTTPCARIDLGAKRLEAARPARGSVARSRPPARPRRPRGSRRGRRSVPSPGIGCRLSAERESIHRHQRKSTSGNHRDRHASARLERCDGTGLELATTATARARGAEHERRRIARGRASQGPSAGDNRCDAERARRRRATARARRRSRGRTGSEWDWLRSACPTTATTPTPRKRGDEHADDAVRRSRQTCESSRAMRAQIVEDDARDERRLVARDEDRRCGDGDHGVPVRAALAVARGTPRRGG